MIKDLLTNKTAKEKSRIKSAEISKLNRDMGGSKNPNWKGGKLEAICEKCGKEFEYQSTAQRGRFCSFNCVRASSKIIARRTMVQKECAECKVTFEGYPDRKFCSKKCMGLSKTGNKSYNWKGGELNRQHHHRRRKALMRGAIGSHTQEEWEKLKKEYGNMCLCCKKQEPEIQLTLDHIIPITKGGTDNIENIQPLCGSCNSKKYNRDFDYRPNHQYAN